VIARSLGERSPRRSAIGALANRWGSSTPGAFASLLGLCREGACASTEQHRGRPQANFNSEIVAEILCFQNQMKVAAAQISCSLGNPDANLIKTRDFVARAREAGAELIVFPEMIDTGYSMPVIQTHAASWTSGFVPGLQEIARKHSIAIVSGVSERDGASIYNSQVFVDREGKISAKYRKTHLYAVAPVEEQTCFAPGDVFASFAIGDLRLGFSICYDLRFPEMYRKLVEQNVGAFIVSSAWPFPRVEHFRTLILARAIENQGYVIAANRVGKDDDLWFCGSSSIVDPRGVAIAAASADREELIHADLSEEVVRSVRSRVGALAHRRKVLYI
jgi:omega-amidase